ncbi:DgyrCDS14979 [Dimorphilus gyrociliatus]|uniref:DgyrCDS14979 n=1 Tax=Dimorphilus gyrociliatus TaxID=2664684 RepID=A0A7I8WFK9_9ANNE|nr:DgyrCDS14979 [Dimorphilus gyrociliatus]
MRQTLHQILFLFSIFYDRIPQVKLLNLARGKAAFQSSTYGTYSNPRKPQFANDANIEISLQNYEYCSRTDKDPESHSWWSVDLEDVYEITKVCLLNINDDIYTNLQQFYIFVGNSPKDHFCLCSFVTDPIKRPSTIDPFQYDCYSCPPTCIGSFVSIQLSASFVELIICDVDVRGSLINKRDSHLLNLTNTKITTGGHYLNHSKEFAIDNDYKTWFRSKSGSYGSFTKPYFLIDCLKTLKVHDILKRFKQVFISVKQLPETDFNSNSQFCVEQLSGLFRTGHELLIVWCHPILTGRYILISMKDSINSDKILELTEIYAYISEFDKHEAIETGNSLKSYLMDVTLNNVSLSNNHFDLLIDNVYYINDINGRIPLNNSDILTLRIRLIHINSICLTVFHTTNFTAAIQINIRHFLNNSILSLTISTFFKYSHTVCVKFNSILTKNIIIQSQNAEELAEIDLIAVSTVFAVGGKCLDNIHKWTYSTSLLPNNSNPFYNILLEGVNTANDIAVYKLKTATNELTHLCENFDIFDEDWNSRNGLLFQCKKFNGLIEINSYLLKQSLTFVHIF